MANDLHSAKDSQKKVQKIYATQCSKTLQKYAVKMINGTMAWAFSTWRENMINMVQRDSIICSVKKNMNRLILKQALSRWKQSTAKQEMMLIMDEMCT